MPRWVSVNLVAAAWVFALSAAAFVWVGWWWARRDVLRPVEGVPGVYVDPASFELPDEVAVKLLSAGP